MRFSVIAGALSREVALLTNVAGKRTGLAVLNCVKLAASGKGLSVVATDIDTTLRSSCDAEVAEPGEILIDAKRLGGLLQSYAPDASVTFEVQKDSWIQIVGGGSKVRLPGLPAEDFPAIAERPTDPPATIPAAVAAELLRRAAIAAVADVTAPGGGNYSSMRLVVLGGQATACATDGHRASLVARAVEPSRDVTVFGNAGSFGLLARLLKDGAGLLEIRSAEARAWFAVGGRELIVKLEERPFPPIEKSVTRSKETALEPIQVDRLAMASALRRADLAAPGTGKVACRAVLRLTHEALEVRSEAGEGAAETSLPVAFAGKPSAGGYSCRYLLEFLAAATSERVTFQLGVNDNACVFEDEPGHSYIVMGMRAIAEGK